MPSPPAAGAASPSGPTSTRSAKTRNPSRSCSRSAARAPRTSPPTPRSSTRSTWPSPTTGHRSAGPARSASAPRCAPAAVTAATRRRPARFERHLSQDPRHARRPARARRRPRGVRQHRGRQQRRAQLRGGGGQLRAGQPVRQRRPGRSRKRAAGQPENPPQPGAPGQVGASRGPGHVPAGRHRPDRGVRGESVHPGRPDHQGPRLGARCLGAGGRRVRARPGRDRLRVAEPVGGVVVTAVRPQGQSRVKALDIPRISLISWLGLESVIWGVVISHLVKWAGNSWYFLTWQVRYAVGYGRNLWTVWYLKDWWDRLPVHVSNALGYHWADQAAPALVPIALVGVLAWKLPWLTRHGWQVPAAYGALASEVNGFIAAGTWITVLMGILGGLAAKPVVRRVADDIQWFFAERSASKIRDESGLNRLRGTHVIGTPAHRIRVRWLLDHRTRAVQRSPWVVRILLAVAFLAVLAAGFGAWLTLAGPAAVH